MASSHAASSAARAGNADLAVNRIALFNSGVGYFECGGTVTGDAIAELKFRTDQINDILKSLVVQDLDGGRVGTVGYASQDPIEKALRSFGVDLTGTPTLADLLGQLRGERVEIAGERSLTGFILGVEKRIERIDDKLVESDILNLLTDSGMVQLNLGSLRGINLLSPKADGELRKALATLARGHDADKKTVALNFNGQGNRRVRAAYMLETPIWKTSYRLVLSDDKQPFLQGWATVENATEEDWSNVRLSLVSGRPISFRMDLYTPLYVPRPLEQLELYASLRPPQYEGSVEEKNQRLQAKSMALGRRERAAGLAGRADMAAAPAPTLGGAVEMAEEPELDLADGGVESVAAAQEAGELFEYVIQTPVSIPRQHSAMLPIVNQEVEGTKVSIYNPATHAKHPLNGLELVNATSLNLMQGPVTVFDGNIYAGDAKLPDLSPAEKRLIAYALDLSTEVTVDHQPQVDQLVSLRIAKGTLVHRHKYVDSRTYQIKNKAGKSRTVIVEQPYSSDWKLIEPKEADERTGNLLRFRVAAKESSTTGLPVSLERYGDSVVVLSDIDFGTIEYFLRASVISPKVRDALQKVVAIRTELDQLMRELRRLEQAMNEAVAEQTRIRENLKTLPRDSDQYQRQLKQFDEIDGQIRAHKQAIAEARARVDGKRRELETYLVNLDLE